MLLFHGLLTVLLIGIFFYDLTRYIIPNWMSGILLALYPVFLLTMPLPVDYSIPYSILVFVAVFILGMLIFALRWAGGGDVKLLAVLALWTGVSATTAFLFLTALLGGLVALLLISVRPIAGRFYKIEDASEMPRLFRHGEPLPYGLAITVAFLYLLWNGHIAGLPV